MHEYIQKGHDMRCYTDVISSSYHLETFLQKSCSKITGKDKALIQLYLNHEDFKQYGELIKTIRHTLGTVDIIGIESDHNINSQGQITSESVIHITLLNQSHYTLFAFDAEQMNQYDFGGFVVRNYCTKFSKTLMLYSNVLWNNCQESLCAIKEIAPYIMLHGGIIPNEHNECVFLNDQILTSGCVGIVFDAMDFHSNSYHNFVASPIGKEHIVSKGFGPYIQEIDHMNAKDFYLNQLGNSKQANDLELHTAFPLLVKKDTGYFPKKILEFTEEGFIKLNSNITIGDTLCLGYSSIKHLKSDVQKAYETIKDFSAETIYVFKNLSRYQITSKNTIHTVANDFLPVTGFLTQLEFITNDNQIEVCIGSFVVISLSETANNQLKNLSLKVQTNIEYDKEYLVLINIIDNISQELNLLDQEIDQKVRQKTAAIGKLYYRDAVTQLPNFHKLKDFITKKRVHTLAIIDVKNFMHISRFYGSHFSQTLLYDLGQLILSTVSRYDCFAYCIHLDVFAVSSKSMNQSSFNSMIESLIDLIHHHTFKDKSLALQITTTTAISHNLYQIYENANMTLDYAKSNDIDFLIYDRSLEIETKIQNNLIWTSNLQSAISNNRIIPYFQPVYNPSTNKIAHYEVLMRVIDDLGNIHKPYTFLELSKKALLYKTLSQIIIKKAFAYFSKYPYDFSINITVADILDGDTCQLIYKQLDGFRQQNQVIFEITDAENIKNMEPIKTFIKQIKTHGALIALDSFGSGFFNFKNLYELDVDILKVDGSIIQSVDSNDIALSVAATIIEFTKKGSVMTIAKSVSSASIYNMVKTLGFDYAQGNYIAKPSEAADVNVFDQD